MIYILLGFVFLVSLLLLKDKDDHAFNYARILFLFLVILFFSVDLFFMYQGEMINKFYNEGEGILYKDLRSYENGTTYYVNVQMFDYHDTTVGNYISWARADFETMKLIAPILTGSVVFIFLFIIYYFLKRFKFIGGI